MFRVVSDCSCDSTRFDDRFVTVPLTVSTDEREFLDDLDLDVHEMLDYLAAYKGRSYTACPSQEAWMEAFGDADEIIVTTLTSFLSGAYNSACLAKELYLETHPDAKIYVVDSLSTAGVLRLINEKAFELKEKGLEFDEICRQLESYKVRTRLFFGFKSLHNFAQNGRVNKVLASAIGALGIHILGTANAEGNIEPMSKCRGEKKLMLGLLKELKAAGYKGGKAKIAHVENESFAHAVAEKLRAEFPKADIEIYKARGLVSYYAERGGLILCGEC